MAWLTAGVELPGRNFRQHDVLPNFARVPSALSSEVQYKCTDCFGAAEEIDFLWNNAAGITGPHQTPLPSAKDRNVQPLAASGRGAG